MKRIAYIYFTIFFIFIGTSCKVLQELHPSNMLGTYVHRSIERGGDNYDYSLTLFGNKFILEKIFTSSFNPDCEKSTCQGEWNIANDTLFLHCHLQSVLEPATLCYMHEREYSLLIRGECLILGNGLALCKQNK
jgi:hypothetical protein